MTTMASTFSGNSIPKISCSHSRSNLLRQISSITTGLGPQNYTGFRLTSKLSSFSAKQNGKIPTNFFGSPSHFFKSFRCHSQAPNGEGEKNLQQNSPPQQQKKNNKKKEDEELEEVEDFFEDLVDAAKLFSQGDIDSDIFFRMVLRSLLNNFATADLLKSSDWYDVDGQKITDWPQERVDTIFLSKVGFLWEGYLGMEPKSGAKRVDWILERDLQKTLFANSPFTVTAVEEQEDGSKCFFGEISGDTDEAYQILKARLTLSHPELLLFLTKDDVYDAPACHVAYRDSFAISRGFSKLLLAGSTIAVFIWSNGLLKADPTLVTGGALLWNGLLFPLGLLLIMFSGFLGQALCSLAYKVPISTFYFPLPAPGFGLVGLAWNDRSLLPNRACLIDQALASSAATLTASLVLMAAHPPPVPFYLRLLANDFGWTETASALRDVVLIDGRTFQYSAVISEFASHLSVATFQMPTGESLMAIGPFALAGLVGLNMTALNLLPFGVLNGGRIIQGVGGMLILLACCFITMVAVLFLTISNLDSFWPWYGLGIAFVGVSTYEMQRNELTPPGLLRTMVGLGSVGMGVFVLLPNSVFYKIFVNGPGILVEQIGYALSLFSHN